MRQQGSFGTFALGLFIIVIALELFGARAYVVSSAHADPRDPCFGYAICR